MRFRAVACPAAPWSPVPAAEVPCWGCWRRLPRRGSGRPWPGGPGWGCWLWPISVVTSSGSVDIACIPGPVTRRALQLPSLRRCRTFSCGPTHGSLGRGLGQPPISRVRIDDDWISSRRCGAGGGVLRELTPAAASCSVVAIGRFVGWMDRRALVGRCVVAVGTPRGSQCGVLGTHSLMEGSVPWSLW